MKSDDDHEFSLVSQDIIPFQQCPPSELESRFSKCCLAIEALPLQRVTNNGKENFLRNREYFINGSSTDLNNSISRHVSYSKKINTDNLHENTKISPFNMNQSLRDSSGQNQVDNSFISNSPLIPYEEEKIRNNTMVKCSKSVNDKVPFTDPELKKQEFLSKINSSDWRKKCEALHIMKIFSKHHTNNMNINEYSQAIRHIIPEVKNLRSAVSRLAINTLKDIFFYSMDPMSLNYENVCECLLNKTSESNAFIRDDVDKCLEVVVEKITPCKIAQALIFYGSGHKSSVVRMYTCKFLSKLVSLPMDEPIFMSNTDQDLKPFLGQILLPIVSRFAFDCCNKTRFFAKEVLFKLMTEPNFENYLRSCLNSQDLRDIQKILYSLRTKGLENSVFQSVKDIAKKSHTKNNTNGQIIKNSHSPIDKCVSSSPISNESQNSSGNKGFEKLSQSQISNGNHQSNNGTSQSHIPNGYKSILPSKIPVKLNGHYSIKNGIKSTHLNGHHESSDSSLSLGMPQNSNTTNSTDSSYGAANDIFFNSNLDSDTKKCLPIHRNKSRAYANMVRKSRSFCRGEQMPITPSPDPIITIDAYNGNSRFEGKWKDIKGSSNIMAETGSVSQIPSLLNRSKCASFNGTSLNACQFLPPLNCRQGQQWRQSDMCINRPKPRSKSTSLIKQSPSFKSTFHLVKKSNNAIEYHPIVLNWNGNGKFSITANQLIENVIDDILRGDFKRKIAAMERLKDIVVTLCQATWTDSNPKIAISLRMESLDQMDRTTNTPLDITFNKSLLWNELDAKAYKIFDAFLPRLTDTNSKIQLSSLQTLQDLTVLIKMSPGSLGSLVPNVISCLASKIPDIQECASNLLNKWTNELDGTYLLKPLVNQAQHGNIHIRTIIIDKIASLVDILLHSKPKQTKIHLIPLLKELLKSVKMTGATVRGGGYPFEESFKNLLKIIHNHVGGEELFNYFKPIDPSEQAFIIRCFKLNTNEYV